MKIAMATFLNLTLSAGLYAQWTQNTTSGIVYPTTLTDKVGIGRDTQSGDAILSVRGKSHISDRLSVGGVPTNIANMGKLHVADGDRIISFSPAGVANKAQWLLLNHGNLLTGMRYIAGPTSASDDDKYTIGGTSPTNSVAFSKGRLGIGTNTPANWLEIQTNSGDNGIVLKTNATGEAPFITWKENATTAESKYSMRYSTIERAFYMGYGDASGFTQQVSIAQATGNVGVGVKTASEKLEVAGNIKTSGTVYANSIRIKDWSIEVPDYVFESSYKLTPLKETEKFIKANKHLEGIPNAKKMKAEGMNVAEMNLKLLKKIEELTLHIIEQDKRLQRLEGIQ